MSFFDSPLRCLGAFACFFVVGASQTGCENWPLYQHLPSSIVGPPLIDPTLVDVSEDDTLPAGQPQLIDAVTAPTLITVSGSMGACGFDDGDENGPIWPDHPIDSNGDGVADDAGPHYSGWYTDEVDWYAIDASASSWLSVDLSWDNAPSESFNAPFLPSDPSGAWTDETDLDFLVFLRDGDGVGEMLSDTGFSARYPERTPQLLPLVAGEGLVIAVACHHELPSDYSLELLIADP